MRPPQSLAWSPDPSRRFGKPLRAVENNQVSTAILASTGISPLVIGQSGTTLTTARPVRLECQVGCPDPVDVGLDGAVDLVGVLKAFKSSMVLIVFGSSPCAHSSRCQITFLNQGRNASATLRL